MASPLLNANTLCKCSVVPDTCGINTDPLYIWIVPFVPTAKPFVADDKEIPLKVSVVLVVNVFHAKPLFVEFIMVPFTPVTNQLPGTMLAPVKAFVFPVGSGVQLFPLSTLSIQFPSD